jgi:hypothetical protein
MRYNGECMKRAVLILAVLLALIFFAQSKSPINIGGSDGNLLMRGLTNNSTSNSSNFTTANNTTIDLSNKTTPMMVGGDDGTILLKDLTNDSSNFINERNTSINLSDWGSKPRTAPLPGEYDYKTAQMNAVIRMNHLGY